MNRFFIVALLLFVVLLGSEAITPVRYQVNTDPEFSDNCPTPRSSSDLRDSISADIRSIIKKEILPAFRCDLGDCKKNPALSCNHIYSNRSTNVSGYYWLKRCDGSTFRAYCAMDNPCNCSGNGGGWRRIAFVNTTDPSQPCPGGTRPFRESNPIRTCARMTHGCVSLMYDTNYMQYQHICGRVIGYQHRSPDAFSSYNADTAKTIDENYIDGVSITYGHSPRKHIWSFAVGLDETTTDINRCPCANRNHQYTSFIPPFIGNDYFCETGSRTAVGAGFYPNDPVWDGEGCGSVSTCCSFNNPPWFCKALSQTTRENVELRMCGDEGNDNENIPVQLIELYVQ